MAKENNFTKAVKELLGEKENMDSELLEQDSTGTVAGTGVRTPGETSQAGRTASTQTSTPPVSSTSSASTFSFGGSSSRPVSSSGSSQSATSSSRDSASRDSSSGGSPSSLSGIGMSDIRPVSSLEPTFINKETVITGSITSKTDIRNEGQVTGDITTQENVCVTGKVDGNIAGNSVQIIGGYVVGNVTAKSDIANDFSSIIIGDITGENFSSDGKVKGNLKINNAVSLKSNAIICGNVSSRKLSVQDGAVIKGNVQIISPKSTDDDTFAVPKGRLGVNVDDDMFEIPKHPASKQVDDREFTMPQYNKPTSTAATSDLFASLKSRMLEKTDGDGTDENKKDE